MAKKKSKTKVALHHPDNAVDVRKFINPTFMNMPESEIQELQAKIRDLEEDAERALSKEPWKKNETYLRDDVVHPVEGGDPNAD